MRVILMIAFFLQVSLFYAQDFSETTITLDKAIQIALANKKDLTGSKNLKYEVRTTWYSWLYSILKWQTLNDYQLAINDLGRIASLHYESGDADLSETSSLIGKLAEVETSTAVAANEIEINKTALCRLLFLDEIGAPADTIFSIYEIDKGLSDVSGYSMQNDSITVKDEFIRSKTMEIKSLELDNLFIYLQYYQNYALNHAETIIRTTSAGFRLEEIDYIEYIHKLGEAFQIRLEYLELLNNYNQKAIQLEYYAY